MQGYFTRLHETGLYIVSDEDFMVRNISLQVRSTLMSGDCLYKTNGT